MTRPGSNERDVTLPATTLLHLRRAIGREAGAHRAVHTLQDAGFAAGEAFFQAFVREVGEEPGELPESRFWEELDRFFEIRGWGRIDQERIHPAFGLLRARDWGESDETAGERQPGCAFSAGVFAHILGQVGGGPIAVLEVGCRSRGDTECSFLVGSETAIHQAYGHLLDGDALDTVLTRL